MAEAENTVGHYTLLERIGSGGMGEVFRARDEKLKRIVAIKFLARDAGADPVRRERFLNEARAASALNHPGIVAVHEIGQSEADGRSYIVMEYVEGRSLRQAMAAERLPFDRALDLACQVADTLALAHEKGIVHRDIKPDNIMVTSEGYAKVLDFGLAKLAEADAVPECAADSSAATKTALTKPGTVMGTAAYMSPEQVAGRALDYRSDIFSFGVVLFEMFTCRPAFLSKTGVDLMHAILHQELPSADSVDPELPGELGRIIETTTRKDPAERFQSTRDLALELKRLRRETSGGRPVLATARPARSPTLLSILLPPDAALALGERPAVALSPDGRNLVYVARHSSGTQLYLRPLDRLEPAPLAGTEGASGPFFSPDGQWVGFFANGKLKKLSLTGGAPLAICDAPESRGACWAPDDTILFTPAPSAGLWRVSSSGSSLRAVTTPDWSRREITHRWPEVLPGGKAALFVIGTAGSASYDNARIALVSLESGETRVVIEGGACVRYAPTGHILFTRAAMLLAAPFDSVRLELAGPVVSLVEGAASENTGAAHWTFSHSGSLLYAPGAARTADRNLLWVSRGGEETELPAPPRMYEEPRLSPDGRRLAVGIRGPSNDVWICEIARGVLSRLTFEGDNFAPVWTPDAKWITFSSNRDGPSNIFWTPAESAAQLQRLTASECDQVAGSWSPDGRRLAFTQFHPETGADIWILSLRGDRVPRPFLRTPFNEWGPTFSPDGRWLAYTSDESGRPEVYVQAFPGPGQKRQISPEGGAEPIWSRNRAELFYRNGDSIMAVGFRTRPSFSVSKPRTLFSGPYLRGSAAYLPGYDVSPDGRRFVMVRKPAQQAETRELRVILDWFADLECRAARWGAQTPTGSGLPPR